MQKWMPRPKAKWGQSFVDTASAGSEAAPGDGRFAAAHMSNTRLWAGMATPPMLVSPGV